MYGVLPHVFLGLTVEEMAFDVGIAWVALQERKTAKDDGASGPPQTEEETTAKLLKALQG